MIIIITGASHTGKTLLAQKLLERYGYPYLSIDHLKMGLIRSGYTDLTPEDDDALAEYLWPVVRGIIKTAVENRQDLIVEGCYVPPALRQDFDERYLPFIRVICLAMTEGYIEEHFDDIIRHESDIESRLIEADCDKERLIQCNRYFAESFKAAGEDVVIIGSDYEKTVEELVKDSDRFMVREKVMAKEEDRKDVMALYKAQIGRPFCPWDEDYPSDKTIDWDLSRDALFVLKENGKIKAAVSLEKDENVDKLPCWSKELEPSGELARLAVLPGQQNRGIGREMLRFGMDELKRRGYKGVHFLVNKYNIKAIRSYAVFGFNVVGECRMYDQDFLCYEKEL